MSQRRYYILTAAGELGPHNRLELREMLDAGSIAGEDRLRTASGAAAGTVTHLLDGAEESSYREEAVMAVDTGTPRRGTRGGRRQAESEEGQRRLPIVLIAVVAVLGVGLLGWWLSRSDASEASKQEAALAVPVASITASNGVWLFGYPGAFLISLNQPSAMPLTIDLQTTGSAVPGIDFAPLPARIEIPAGTTSVRLECHPCAVTCGRRPAVAVGLTMQPGKGFTLSDEVTASSILRNDERQPGDPSVVWLSDLPYAGEWTFAHPAGRNVSWGGIPLTVGGQTYAKGFGTHPGVTGKDHEALIGIALDGKYTAFLTDIGIDGESGKQGSVVFRVFVDGHEAFTSPVKRGGEVATSIRIDVTGAKQLKLVVNDAGDSNNQDHADWVGARLIGK